MNLIVKTNTQLCTIPSITKTRLNHYYFYLNMCLTYMYDIIDLVGK